MTHVSLSERVKAWLAARLGKRYPVLIDGLDRALAAFVSAFLARVVLADALDVHRALQLSYWETAALAGLAAAVSIAKSVLLTLITGDPALLSLVSTSLRARRQLTYRPRHDVPLRPVKPRLR